MPDVTPFVVLMSGAPASEKSTLSRELGRRLQLPVIDKDELRRGQLMTYGTPDLGDVPPGPRSNYTVIEGVRSARLRLSDHNRRND